jgi:type IV secretory pathway TrbD component
MSTRHPVYKAMIRPLTLMGVERRLFFLALLLGAATFNLFYSFLAGLLTSGIVYGFARVCAAVDRQMLPILFRSFAGRPRYDAARHELGNLRR